MAIKNAPFFYSAVEWKHTKTPLSMILNTKGEEGVALTAPIPVKPPFLTKLIAIEFNATTEQALVYGANAPAVTRPYDWATLDETEMGLGSLEITIRDPFMIGALPGRGRPWPHRFLPAPLRPISARPDSHGTRVRRASSRSSVSMARTSPNRTRSPRMSASTALPPRTTRRRRRKAASR